MHSFLSGLHEPVRDEQTLTDLQVIGEIPGELHGVYALNSPNPRFAPRGRYHWFDGDGMVHAIHLEKGRATYRNRYVRTASFAAEEEAQEPLWSGILEKIDPKTPGGPDKDTGNTDLVWHAKRLLALWWLGGVPYELDPVSLQTKGPADFGDGLKCGIASHPKVSPVTGEMMFFDYSPYQAPFLTYGVADRHGKVTHTQTIDVPGPRLFHDIAITERHTIFMDLPMLWDTSALAHQKRKVDFRKDMPSRFGIVPRAGGDVRWFEAPACYIYHTINAYESGDEIVMTACRIEDPVPKVPHDDEPHIPRLYFLRLHPFLTRWRFNLKTGEVKEEQLDDVPTEFPRINDLHLGREARFGYCPRVAKERELLFDALMKYDLHTGDKQVHVYGEETFADESVFAPDPKPKDEDDGWIVHTVHNRRDNTQELRILDAKNFEAPPVARVKIPARFPMGFHACWVPGKELL